MTSLLDLFPIALFCLAVLFMIYLTWHCKKVNNVVLVDCPWQLPAACSVVFLGYAAYSALQQPSKDSWILLQQDGAVLFAWEWINLLVLVWILILPRAMTVAMKPFLWLLLVICTGSSVGLLAMLARILYLEQLDRASNRWQHVFPILASFDELHHTLQPNTNTKSSSDEKEQLISDEKERLIKSDVQGALRS
jgi:hypothetical protein